jgi:hypothetical protein
MARVELQDKWIVAGKLDAVRAAVLTYLKITGMKIVEESGNQVRAKQGSQFLTRLLGGWFVSAATLPKAVIVSTRQTVDGVLVRARIEETMGFGFLDPILAGKYDAFFEKWMTDLESASDRAGQEQNHPGSPRRIRDEKSDGLRGPQSDSHD